ncbi:MAG: Ig-like domain-containing protein, partial [Clostridia bacterium]|nr:Ig-like domain-containing protein [Clostridia bacterium]
MRNRIVSTVCAALVMMLAMMMWSAAAMADAEPESIVLSEEQIIIDLAEGATASLRASVLPAAAEQDVEWKSSNRDVIRSSSSGKLTARSVGTAVITAVSEEDDSVLATCRVTVIDSDVPEKIVLSKNEITLDLAGTSRVKLIASAEPAAANQRVRWKTASSSIARVSSSGEITARRVGTTVIRASSREDSKVYAECIVNVIDTSIPERIVLNKNELVLDLAKPEGVTLAAVAEPAIANQRVRWKTSSSSIARVSSKGVVTPRRVGTAVIKAQSYEDSDIYAECTVRVIDSRIPTSISLTGMGAALEMDRYESLQLTAVAEPSIADQTVQWKSSKSSVVYVSSKGVLTAKKGGTATITCYSKRDSSVKAVLQVTVKQYPTPEKIELSPAATVMVKGETLDLNPVTYPANTKVCEYFTWKSSSSSRASVDENGLVTAKKTGWVTITCASKQNSRVKETRKILIVTPDSPHYIHIENKETGALLNEQTITLNPTDTIQLMHQVLPADKNEQITWKSSRTSYATVDEN